MRSGPATLALLLAVAGLAMAQKPEPAPRPTPVEPAKDPTQPSPDLKKALDPGKTLPGTAPRSPALALKGRVIVKGKPPAALIEIDGKGPPLLVGKDQTISTGGVSYKVLEVNVNEVRLQGGPSGEIIVLR